MAVFTVGVFSLARADVRQPGRVSLLLMASVGFLSAVVWQSGQHASGAAQACAHALLLAAALCLLVVLLHRDELRWLAAAAMALAACACVAGIIASPRPPIDVFWMLQGSSHALVHGRNIYTQTWTGSHGITNLFPYLPGTTLLVTPFYLVFGDARYALVAALVVAAVVVMKLAAGRAALVLACVILLFPRVLFGIEQAWTEPLLLALIATMVWSVEAGRPTLAVVCLAGALATKQHVIVLLPLAAVWPDFGWRRTVAATGAAAVAILGWFAASPRAFVHGAITYNLRLPPRRDSLSLFTSAIRAGWTPSFVVVPVLMIVAVGAALWLLPRTTSAFVLGSAWLLGVFDLLNKQSFFNEWSLVIGLMVVGLAVMSRADRTPTSATEPEVLPEGCGDEGPGDAAPTHAGG
ncbi:MAG: glycosyltransferase 87 family protein [Acidimicrobiales bacterium]